MPDPGGWQEALMVLVWQRKQEIQRTEARLLTQAIVTPKEGKHVQQALEDFSNALYPFRKDQIKEREQQAKAVLHDWTSMGPIAVRPLGPTTNQAQVSRLRRRGAAAEKLRAEAMESGNLVRIGSKEWRERAGARPSKVRRARRRT